MIEISSKDNNIIKDLVKFRDQSRFRDDKSLFYVEGERIIKDIPHDLIDKIFVHKGKLNYYNDFLNKYDNHQIYVLDEKSYDKVKDTVNSQGLIATVKYNLVSSINDNYVKNLNSILVLDSISDPGNLGTIIRLSEAANISLVILTNNCCSLYNTKVIRSCMSSIFRTNIYISNDIIKDITVIKSNGFNIYSTAIDKNKKRYIDLDYKNKCVIILGNEANGVCKELINISNNTIYIPMSGDIESLNVAVAATVICYEIMRQNNFYEA